MPGTIAGAEAQQPAVAEEHFAPMLPRDSMFDQDPSFDRRCLVLHQTVSFSTKKLRNDCNFPLEPRGDLAIITARKRATDAGVAQW